MSSALFQPSLINELPEGFYHFKGMVEPMMQERLVQLVRQLCRQAPLITPQTMFGTDFNLKITSWGAVGWLSDKNGYRYVPVHPATGREWPEIPEEVSTIMQAACDQAGFENFDLQTVLVNLYDREVGKLGRHKDKTEKDHTSPIVTISLGDSCIFGIGGPMYSDPLQEIALDSGDICVQGGPARMHFHEVIRILPGTSSLLRRGGRISLTGRTYI